MDILKLHITKTGHIFTAVREYGMYHFVIIFTNKSYQYLNAFNRIPFGKLNTRIFNPEINVKREFKKLCIAYKADTNFLDVVIQGSRFHLAVNIKFGGVVGPKGICRDKMRIGRWGNGDIAGPMQDMKHYKWSSYHTSKALRSLKYLWK